MIVPPKIKSVIDLGDRCIDRDQMIGMIVWNAMKEALRQACEQVEIYENQLFQQAKERQEFELEETSNSNVVAFSDRRKK